MEALSLRLSTARVVSGALFLGIAFIFVAQVSGWNWPHAFFDGRVFIRAIAQIRAGHNPYDLIYGSNPDVNHMPFVYPPAIGWFLQGIARTAVPLWVVEKTVFVLVIGGILAATLSSIRLFFDFSIPLVILCFGAFASLIAGGGAIAADTGNISSLFWGLALAASLPGFSKSRWGYFHVAVFVATLFKPYFATLWLIPVLAPGWSWRELWIGAATAALSAAIFVLVAAVKPELAAAWASTLASRVQAGDAGFGIYGLLHWRLGSSVALAIHAIYVVALVGMLHFGESRGRLRYAALIIIAINANPRLNGYDFAYAAIPALYIYTVRLEQLLGLRRGAWVSLFLGLIIAGFTCEIRDTTLLCIWLVLFLGGAVVTASQRIRLNALEVKWRTILTRQKQHF